MIGSIDEIYESIQQIVSLASGIEMANVILANQLKSPPSSTDLYATYNPIPVRAYGHPRRERDLITATEPGPAGWEDYEETLITSLELLVSVNFINSGAREAAYRIHNANYMAAIREKLHDNGIGWRYAGNIRNLTALYQAEYQQRYQVDIFMFVEVASITDVILKAAGFTVEIQDENGNQF